jgi:hypothetical protein
VPPGVRVFGVGATRPVLVLAPNTPGFQKGVGTMIVFTGGDQYQVGEIPVPVPTVVPPTDKVRDANSGTFYSAMANVDIEIGAGNPAAAAVRFRMAQHAFLSHMNFRLGSAFAGVYQAGNIMEDVHFQGGRYGIVTEKTSPAWQFTLIDSTFDGQRDAAIREHEVDLTLVNVAIKNTPVGIEIDRGYSDSLWGKNVRFENVSKAGVVISAEDNVFTQVGFDNAVAPTPRCSPASATAARPWPARAAPIGWLVHLRPDAARPGPDGRVQDQGGPDPLAALPAASAPALRALPPVADWTNVKTLGVKGDGQTDDTAALQKAIDTHRVLYLPIGFYKVTDTLKLRPDTVLIGLHPAVTQLVIPDDNPRHAGVGPVAPVLETPKGGDNILFGLGIFTGRVNPRASALLWRSGADSQVTDVKIMGGGGTPTMDGKPLGAAQARSGDPVADGRWDGQYPSIWVTDGGGGTFANVWSPNTFASAGFYISDTSTPGPHLRGLGRAPRAQRVRARQRPELGVPGPPDRAGGRRRPRRRLAGSAQLAQHPVRQLSRLSGDAVVPSGRDGGEAVQLDRHPLPQRPHQRRERRRALRRRSAAAPMLRASKFPFENAIQDKTRKLEVREREFAVLDVTANPSRPRRSATARCASWRAASGRSPARPSGRTARCISSRSASSGSIAGRRPRAWRWCATTRWIR